MSTGFRKIHRQNLPTIKSLTMYILRACHVTERLKNVFQWSVKNYSRLNEKLTLNNL
jgi:hypothetical protein